MWIKQKYIANATIGGNKIINRIDKNILKKSKVLSLSILVIKNGSKFLIEGKWLIPWRKN